MAQRAFRAYSRQKQGAGGAVHVPENGQSGQDDAKDARITPEETESVAGSRAGNAGRQNSKKPDGTVLSDEELREVAQLQKIDTKVRAHEMAHLEAAGAYARGGARFQLKRGPDGRNYAVGGDVSIDVSKEATLRATISKMEVVKAAALAPADPSPQDRRVAAAAVAVMGEARQELRLDNIAKLASRQEQSEVVRSASDGRPQAVSGEADSKAAPKQGATGKGRRQAIGSYFNPERSNLSTSGFATVV